MGICPGGGHGNPLQYSCLDNPMAEEPGRLQSMGSQRVGHDRATKHSERLGFKLEEAKNSEPKQKETNEGVRSFISNRT